VKNPAAKKQLTQISQGSWISESDQSRRAEITGIAWRAVGNIERGRLQECAAASVPVGPESGATLVKSESEDRPAGLVVR
jgi:hypothetical protein